MSLRPFHLAFPVHDLAAARAFYGGAMGCPEGRSSSEWIERRPDFRSRFSCARWMRIWLARARASIL